MAHRIQGVVGLDVSLDANGDVVDVRLTKSLDKDYGLDEEALEAARKWLFDPATKDGTPVPVVVTLELEFKLK
jgi:protein TonB